MLKRLSLALLAAASVAVVSTPAFAGSSGVTGTISLGGANKTAATTSAWPAYGDTVGFATTVQGKASPKGNVYVTTVCLQGSTVVYQASGAAGSDFALSDQGGQGLDWNGGAANCIAVLVYRVDGGKGTSTITYLAQTTFDVAVAS
jgi:hypothetical protein